MSIRLPAIDPAVWQKDWGVHLQPFGSGENIIKYLGSYVCRTAIGDSRILSVSDTHVSFRWKDRANGDAQRVETIEGAEFVRRYLRHVLPRGLRADPLLRLLPPCGQSQTRAHRLPHRTAAARRRAARHARETTPRRRLPVLRRADEKTAAPVARLESRPRATTGETILRMIHAHHTIPMRGGIFQSHGPCPGELCPACGNNRCLPAPYVNPTDSTPVKPAGFMPTTVRFTHAMGIPRIQQPLLSEKLQTQNA